MYAEILTQMPRDLPNTQVPRTLLNATSEGGHRNPRAWPLSERHPTVRQPIRGETGGDWRRNRTDNVITAGLSTLPLTYSIRASEARSFRSCSGPARFCATNSGGQYPRRLNAVGRIQLLNMMLRTSLL